MTKQEQIEEMAKIVDEMYNVYTTTADDIAEALYNAGYRKVVSGRDGFVELLNEETKELSIIEKTRKETAKEILQEWADDNSSMGLDNTFVKNIAKKYGVEVEE